MREYELRYLTIEVAGQIAKMIDDFASGASTIDSNMLFDKITDLLPIEKLNPDTVRRRVEGYYYASEHIWQKALQNSKESRPELVKRAGLKPLSFYHYLTGSREPRNIVMTRDDYLNDPTTALVKLRDDIIALANVLPSLMKK